jgi:hypothetical protein
MKKLFIAFTSILFASVAYSDEPDLRELRSIGTQALPSRDAWERCTASMLKRAIHSENAAQGIAESALTRCKGDEARLKHVLARRIGSRRAAAVMTELRRQHRDSLVAVIEMLRRR